MVFTNKNANVSIELLFLKIPILVCRICRTAFCGVVREKISKKFQRKNTMLCKKNGICQSLSVVLAQTTALAHSNNLFPLSVNEHFNAQRS